MRKFEDAGICQFVSTLIVLDMVAASRTTAAPVACTTTTKLRSCNYDFQTDSPGQQSADWLALLGAWLRSSFQQFDPILHDDRSRSHLQQHSPIVFREDFFSIIQF